MDIAGTEQAPSDLCVRDPRPWSQKKTQRADEGPSSGNIRPLPPFAKVCEPGSPPEEA